VADFIFQYKDVANVWHNISNYIIILSVPNEADLYAVQNTLRGLNISLTTFNEPDIGNELTAIALLPNDEAEAYCRKLKLAFRKEDMLNSESIKEQYRNTKKKLNSGKHNKVNIQRDVGSQKRIFSNEVCNNARTKERQAVGLT
jgi:hypothetical protein